MQPIASGKIDVIAFLENECLKRTNEQSGEYQLLRDDAGQLILFIEGFAFIGQGTISLGGNLLSVADGSTTRVEKPS
jgi:hypothetical protein